MSISTGINCITSRFGTGMESCQPVEGLPTGVYLTPVGWSLNKTTDTFDSDYVDEQIQLGNFIPFVGTFEMTVETPEPTTQESQSGILSVVRQGKPTFSLKFKKGLAFQKAAYSYNSDSQYGAIIVYDTGYMKVVESVDGTEIKALTIGMLNTNGYSENTGTNSAETIMKFQVTDPLEYNQYAYLLTALDFNPNAKTGIINTKLVARADASDNKIYTTVRWIANEQYPITGLAAANFKITIDGVADTISGAIAYNTTTKEYAITPTSTLTAGDVVVAQLYDAGAAVAVAKLGTKFYEGTSNSATTVA